MALISSPSLRSYLQYQAYPRTCHTWRRGRRCSKPSTHVALVTPERRSGMGQQRVRTEQEIGVGDHILRLPEQPVLQPQLEHVDRDLRVDHSFYASVRI